MALSHKAWCLTLFLSLVPGSLKATIPEAAKADPRYGLGYLVVSYYPGVTNNGTGDCRVGIQAALNDAWQASKDFNKSSHTNRGLAVFFPPGVYQISDVVECYAFRGDEVSSIIQSYVVVGSTEGAPARPKIKLVQGAPKYQSAASPRPLIAFRQFKGTNNIPVPVPNPMSEPAGFVDNGPQLFYAELRNLDFDCGGNPGAVGVVHNGTQWCGIENVKVTATGAFAGFYMLPGAGSCSANLEVEGGQYGLLNGKYQSLNLWVDSGSSSGPVITGLKLQNQTVASMMMSDPVAPITIVGFQIANSKSIKVPDTWSTVCTLTLLDGQIAMNDSGIPAIDNTEGKSLYVRNVYVTGTTNLIKSAGTTTTAAGTGTWKHIVEYCYNETLDVPNVPPNTGYLNKSFQFETFSLINGVLRDRTLPFPVLNVVNGSPNPPADLVSRHLWTSFPAYNGVIGDPPTVVVSTNAGWNNTNDDTLILQAAIDQAHSGNGRVFLPAGQYYITNTLTLRANTVLMGAGWQLSRIAANPLWKPTSGEVSMVQTVDDANATTTLAWLSIKTRACGAYPGTETNYSRFNALHWQAGRNSLRIAAETEERWEQFNDTQARSTTKYTGNGGGRCYGFNSGIPSSGDLHPEFRRIKISGTHEPLWFYGFNIERGKGDMDVELAGASNVRLLGLKREAEFNAMVVINDSTNIGVFGVGAIRWPVARGQIEVLGSSTNVVMANLSVQSDFGSPGTCSTLYEALDGQPVNEVLWPNNVSLYKRGDLDDDVMFASRTPRAPTGLIAMVDPVYPTNQINLSWVDTSTNETGFIIQRKTGSGGIYSQIATLPAEATGYTNTGLAPATTYYYQLAASNSYGSSDWSAEAQASTFPTAPEMGLIGYWTFEEGAGAAVTDQSGNGRDGTFMGSPFPEWGEGKLGSYGLQLSGGSGGYARVPNVPTNWSAGMTLAAWANVRTFANNGRIVARDAESNIRAWGLGVENSANWNFAIPATSGSRTNLFVPFNPATTTNTWVHVAGTYNATGAQPRMKFYTNGVLAGYSDFVPAAIFDTTTNVCLGRRTSSEVLDGAIDEVRIYDRPLSGAEIASLASVPAPQFVAPSLAGGQLILNWIGSGELECASTVNGPWTAVTPKPAPPCSIPINPGSNQFFRLKAAP